MFEERCDATEYQITQPCTEFDPGLITVSIVSRSNVIFFLIIRKHQPLCAYFFQ